MVREVILECQKLSKNFGEKDILKDLDFKINKGEILGLLGPSGQGKSVLIKTLIGFYTPSGGNIIYNFPKDKINFSMQNNSIYSSLTVKQNWNYFGKINGIKKDERKTRIINLLAQLDLDQYKNTLVSKLSGGTKKRVDIGCALINDPDVLILDEPFAGLDQSLVKQLAKYILYLNNQGKTIVITSHRIKLMSRLCGRLLLLKNNKLREIKSENIWQEYEELQ